MRLQYFNPPDGAAGVEAQMRIPVEPGMWALVIAACYVITEAAGTVPRVQLIETATKGNSIEAVGGDMTNGGSAIDVSAAIGVTSGPSTLATSESAQIALPRYPIQNDFTIVLGSATFGAASTVASCRVVVAFGYLEELLQF